MGREAEEKAVGAPSSIVTELFHVIFGKLKTTKPTKINVVACVWTSVSDSLNAVRAVQLTQLVVDALEKST